MFCDWCGYESVLSGHSLKLWSHRYVCSRSSACTWIIHLLLLLFVLPLFLLLLLFTLLGLYLPSLPLISCLISYCLFSLCVSFILTSVSHSVFIADDPSSSLPLPLPLTPTFSLSFSLFSPRLYLSTVLSALRPDSAITALHLLIPVLTQTITSTYTHPTHTPYTPYTHTDACQVHRSPRGSREPGVSAHASLPCRKMPSVEGQGEGVVGAVWTHAFNTEN